MRQKSVNLTTSRPVPNYVCFFFQIREDERKKDDALDSLYDREPHTKRIPKVLLFPLVFFVSRQRSSGLTRKHARMYRRHFGVCLFRYYYIQQQNKGRHQRRFESRTSDSFFFDTSIDEWWCGGESLNWLTITLAYCLFPLVLLLDRHNNTKICRSISVGCCAQRVTTLRLGFSRGKRGEKMNEKNFPKLLKIPVWTI